MPVRGTVRVTVVDGGEGEEGSKEKKGGDSGYNKEYFFNVSEYVLSSTLPSSVYEGKDANA